MKTIKIREAKTHFSQLVEEAASGKPFIIAKAGKPLVKVTALDVPTRKRMRRLGFLRGHISVPKDFNEMGSEQIEELFGGGECSFSSTLTCCLWLPFAAHKDPFDRLLVAQATVEGVTPVTNDARLARCPGPIRKV